MTERWLVHDGRSETGSFMSQIESNQSIARTGCFTYSFAIIDILD